MRTSVVFDYHGYLHHAPEFVYQNFCIYFEKVNRLKTLAFLTYILGKCIQTVAKNVKSERKNQFQINTVHVLLNIIFLLLVGNK